MAYYLNLFSPETYQSFCNSDQDVTGFNINQLSTAKKIVPGDRFICYLTKLSRWIGIFEVASMYFVDRTPMFLEENDPFVVRFKIKPVFWLGYEYGIPIQEDFFWKKLSFTKNHKKTSTSWTGILRGGMNQVDNEDAEYLEKVLITQSSQLHKYPLSEIDHKKIKSLMVRTHDNKHISVSVPIKEEDEIDESKGKAPIRESSIIQAKIAQLGERMGFKVWIPKSDRTKVLENWLPDNENNLLNQLPLNYDETTLFTIEQIDVLWIRNRSIIRAFEVEHTTSIYSGILRMADLMALQPNLDIKAHIVAPIERREKVLPRNK